MPQWMVHQGRTAKLVRLPLGDLLTWHLVCSCRPCRKDRVLPVAELVGRVGTSANLLTLTPKLRCETCRQPPVGVMLRNRYPEQVGGSAYVEAMLKGDYRP